MSASPARVLQVVLSLHPGGTERLVVDLARRLQATMPTALVCLDEAGAWAAGLEAAGMPVTALNRGRGFQANLGKAIASAAREHKATVIHAHHYSPFVYSALARFRLSGVRLVFTEHGRLSDRGPSSKRRLMNQALRRFATRVFAVSEDVRQHLIAEGFRAADVGVIYNGIDVGPLPHPATRVNVRADLGVSDADVVVGTIARLDPVKDLGTLVAAVAALTATSRPVTLVVVGDGAERAALEARVEAAGVADRVVFAGHQDDARRWLAGCDVYANSSISEGVSLTILEAMAAGLPVVATRVGGTPEVVTDDTGLLVPSRNPQALADAIYRLGESSALQRQLGLAGRARVLEHFTIERMVNEYRQVYESRG